MTCADAFVLDRRPAKPVMYGALSNPMLQKVMEIWGPRAFRRTSVVGEFEALLRRLNIHGKCALEIGTYNGLSALILAQFFDEVVAVSVDVQKDLLKFQIAEACGVKNIRFIDAADNAQKVKIVRSLDFDFVYLDGDHTNDTPEDWALVRHCGRVLFHEYWPLQPPVWDLVESLPPDEVTRAHFDCFAYWEAKRG